MIDPEERDLLQAVAVHVLARRRFEVTGRFGLRPTPGGFGTPPFGSDALRVSGGSFVVESGTTVRHFDLATSTLRDLATAAGVDLEGEFSCGSDTPPLPDADRPLAIDGALVEELGAWWWLGAAAIDRVVAGLPGPTVSQLWPEHFDVGASAALSGGVNLGASPGDGFRAEPYLYVGPWTNERPGDPAYWNAPFGAVGHASEIPDLPAAVAFLTEGVSRLGGVVRR